MVFDRSINTRCVLSALLFLGSLLAVGAEAPDPAMFEQFAATMDQVKTLKEQKKVSEAIGVCEAFLRRYPNSGWHTGQAVARIFNLLNTPEGKTLRTETYRRGVAQFTDCPVYTSACAAALAGQRADQVAVAIAFMRGRILLEKGDRKSAVTAFRKAVELYDALPDPLDAAGLGDVRARALRLAKQLELGADRPPFQVTRRTVTLEGPDEDGRWVGRFDVVAPRPFALEVRPENSALKCRLGGAWVCQALEARRRVTVIAMDEPPARQTDVFVFDAKNPKNKVKVLVRATGTDTTVSAAIPR